MELPNHQKIAEMRLKHNLTQKACAKMVRVSLRTWQDWEADHVNMRPGLWELFLLKIGEIPLELNA